LEKGTCRADVLVAIFDDSGAGKRQETDTEGAGYIKVKLSLCLTKHYAMKAYAGVDV
jgi:hypothetical protein